MEYMELGVYTRGELNSKLKWEFFVCFFGWLVCLFVLFVLFCFVQHYHSGLPGELYFSTWKPDGKHECVDLQFIIWHINYVSMLIPSSLCSEFYGSFSRAVDVYLVPKGKTRVGKVI